MFGHQKQCLIEFGRQTFPVWTGLQSLVNVPSAGVKKFEFQRAKTSLGVAAI